MQVLLSTSYKSHFPLTSGDTLNGCTSGELLPGACGAKAKLSDWDVLVVLPAAHADVMPGVSVAPPRLLALQLAPE